MTDDSKWIHPLARGVLDSSDSWADSHGIKILCWEEAGRPLLTDEAKAILQVVEEGIERCNCCSAKKECEMEWIANASDEPEYECNRSMRDIRRAMKGGK